MIVSEISQSKFFNKKISEFIFICLSCLKLVIISSVFVFWCPNQATISIKTNLNKLWAICTWAYLMILGTSFSAHLYRKPKFTLYHNYIVCSLSFETFDRDVSGLRMLNFSIISITSF